MRIAEGLAGYGAQAKTLGRVEAGVFQLAVIPAELFRLAVLEKQLAVVGLVQGLAEDGIEPRPVEPGLIEEDAIGSGEMGHVENMMAAEY